MSVISPYQGWSPRLICSEQCICFIRESSWHQICRPSSSPWRSKQRSDVTAFSLSLMNQTRGRSAFTSFVEWDVASQGLLVVSKPWFFLISWKLKSIQTSINYNGNRKTAKTDITRWGWTHTGENVVPCSYSVIKLYPHLCRTWPWSHLT